MRISRHVRSSDRGGRQAGGAEQRRRERAAHQRERMPFSDRKQNHKLRTQEEASSERGSR